MIGTGLTQESVQWTFDSDTDGHETDCPLQYQLETKLHLTLYVLNLYGHFVVKVAVHTNILYVFLKVILVKAKLIFTIMKF